MFQLYFATGNKEKFAIAQAACRPFDIELIQMDLDIPEIQSEDPEAVVKAKVLSAYEILKQPVVVSDDSWSVPALGGFPGPYMKSIDHWFSSDDFIRLLQPYEDRRIILIAMLAFSDGKNYKSFRQEYVGQILPEPRGAYGRPIQKVITMPGDNGLSVSEVYERGIVAEDREVISGWNTFVEWYRDSKQTS